MSYRKAVPKNDGHLGYTDTLRTFVKTQSILCYSKLYQGIMWSFPVFMTNMIGSS